MSNQISELPSLRCWVQKKKRSLPSIFGESFNKKWLIIDSPRSVVEYADQISENPKQLCTFHEVKKVEFHKEHKSGKALSITARKKMPRQAKDALQTTLFVFENDQELVIAIQIFTSHPLGLMSEQQKLFLPKHLFDMLPKPSENRHWTVSKARLIQQSEVPAILVPLHKASRSSYLLEDDHKPTRNHDANELVAPKVTTEDISVPSGTHIQETGTILLNNKSLTEQPPTVEIGLQRLENIRSRPFELLLRQPRLPAQKGPLRINIKPESQREFDFKDKLVLSNALGVAATVGPAIMHVGDSHRRLPARKLVLPHSKSLQKSNIHQDSDDNASELAVNKKLEQSQRQNKIAIPIVQPNVSLKSRVLRLNTARSKMEISQSIYSNTMQEC